MAYRNTATAAAVVYQFSLVYSTMCANAQSDTHTHTKKKRKVQRGPEKSCSFSFQTCVIQECLAGSDAANVPASNKACYAAVKTRPTPGLHPSSAGPAPEPGFLPRKINLTRPPPRPGRGINVPEVHTLPSSVFAGSGAGSEVRARHTPLTPLISGCRRQLSHDDPS